MYPDSVSKAISAEGGSSGIASICGTAKILVEGSGVMTLTVRIRRPGGAWVVVGTITVADLYKFDLPESGAQIEVICDTGDFTSGSLHVTIYA